MTDNNQDLYLLDLAMDSIEDAIIWVDPEYRVIYCNDGAGLMFAEAPDEVVDTFLLEQIPTLCSGPFRQAMDEFVRSTRTHLKISQADGVWGQRRNGQVFLLTGTVRKTETPNGLILAMHLRDLAATSSSEQRYHDLLESQGSLIVCINPQSVFTYANQAACRTFGKTQAELMGSHFTPQVHPDDLPATIEAMRRLETPPWRTSFEQRLLTPSGWRWFAWENSAIRSQDGQIIEIQGEGRDITENKQAEATLKQSRENLALAIEGSGVGLWDWQIQSGEAVFNERWAGILGYTLEELSPLSIQTWGKFCHPDDLQRSQALLDRHFMGLSEQYECEVRMRHKDGRWIWILDRGRVTEWDQEGRPKRMSGTHLDISERRRMQETIDYRLRFEELLLGISTRFINLADSAVDVEIQQALSEIGELEEVDRSYVFLFDQSADTMSNSHEWCRAGIQAQIGTLQNLPCSELPWWTEQLRLRKAIYVSRLSEFPPEASAEKAILEMQDIRSVAVIPMTFNQKLVGFVGFDAVSQVKQWNPDSIALLQMFANILSNALERKRSERALRESQARNAALLSTIPDMMFRIGRNGIISDFSFPNDIEAAMPRDQIIGSSIFRALGEAVGQQVKHHIEEAIFSGKRQTMTYELTTPQGSQHFEARIVAVGSSEVIAIVRNVSERMRLEQMKSDFINRATHDLRTPLTTILLMVRLLEEENTPEQSQTYWRYLKEELDREYSLIEDLLMVGRLESNRWEVRPQPVNSIEIWQASLQSVESQASNKNIQVEFHVEEPTRLVMGDPSALQQVFTNLLTNAIKFTQSGGQVRVTVRPGKNHSSGRAAMVFEVRDTGIGISSEDLPNLFSRFFRGRNAINAEIDGSGIGLFIVKSIVEKFGGHVQVTSELGRGTTFLVELPVG